MGKIADELSVSLGQTQQEQIWHQWPHSVPKNDCLHYNGERAQNTQQNGRTHESKTFRHS